MCFFFRMACVVERMEIVFFFWRCVFVVCRMNGLYTLFL